MRERSEKSMQLYEMLLQRGYPKPFCDSITENLNTDFIATRMIGYLYHRSECSLEMIVDEMMDILSDRKRFMDKKIAEEANATWNELMRENIFDSDEDDELNRSE